VRKEGSRRFFCPRKREGSKEEIMSCRKGNFFSLSRKGWGGEKMERRKKKKGPEDCTV